MSTAARAGIWSVIRPTSVAAACAALANPAAKPHAGGTDLMVGIKIGRHKPGPIIDLSLISELRGVHANDEVIVIGAMTPMSDLLSDTLVTGSFPALADAMSVVGSVQIRHRATLGGNIANASPAADTVPVLVALDSIAHIAGEEGTRKTPLVSLFAGPGLTTLRPAEIITALEIPIRPRSASAYVRLTRRTSVDLALVSAAVVLPHGARPRVAFGAAGPLIERCPPVEDALAVGWPNAERMPPEVIERAAMAAMESVRPITDVRAGERYRRAMAGVLLRRALRLALTRAANYMAEAKDERQSDYEGDEA
jgi:CO/xanthine dehydrogenase FAD-binding subunit